MDEKYISPIFSETGDLINAEINASLIQDLRYVLKENQSEFWRRFGVSQSSGSRFEHGAAIPHPVAMLIRLYLLDIMDTRKGKCLRSPSHDAARNPGVAPPWA